MRKKIKEEEVKRRLYAIHNDKIKLIKYSGNMFDHSVFECIICGNIWQSSAQSVCSKKKIGCPNCANKKRGSYHKYSFVYVKEYIESRGCILISEQYKNCDKHLEIVFQCGHKGKISFYSFKNGHRCDICAHKKIKNLFRRDINDIFDYLKSKKLKFINFIDGYENGYSKITCICLICGKESTRSINSFYFYSPCNNCSRMKVSDERFGENGSNWKGGITTIRNFLSKQIKNWKIDSARKNDFKCIITGKPFEEIHHLFSFSRILEEAIQKSGMGGKFVSEYNQNELKIIVEKFKFLHEKYGLGIPLTKKIHKKFHQIYGGDGKTIPEDFYDFQNKIKSGEILIPDN